MKKWWLVVMILFFLSVIDDKNKALSAAPASLVMEYDSLCPLDYQYSLVYAKGNVGLMNAQKKK